MPISGLPPELQLDAEQLQQRQRIADMLTQQGNTPFTPPTNPGRIASRASWLQPAAQIFSAYAGNKMSQDASRGSAELGQKYENFLQQGVQDYMRQKQGTGVAPDPQELSQAADGISPPPQAAGPSRNPRELATTAMLSRNPAVQALGKLDYAHEQKLDLPHNTPPGTVTTTGRGTPLVTAAPLHQVPQDWEKNLPAGARKLPTDPPGIFRMKGGDGVEDPYQMEFEGGVVKGYKRLDNVSMSGLNPRLNLTTIQDPLNPVATLQVDAQTFNEGKYKASKGANRTGIVGAGPKPAASGVANAEGFNAFQAVNANFDKLEKQLDLVEKSNLGRVTGLTGALPNVPGSAGSDAQARLDALKSQVGFDTLQALRNAGHSGASGLGQVTEKEHVYLRQQLGNLDKAQSEKEIRRVVGDIKTWLAGARKRIRKGYEVRFENAPLPGGGGAGATPPPDGFKPL